jgi:hypothetical protein
MFQKKNFKLSEFSGLKNQKVCVKIKKNQKVNKKNKDIILVWKK